MFLRVNAMNKLLGTLSLSSFFLFVACDSNTEKENSDAKGEILKQEVVEKTLNLERVMKLENVANVRELGGIETRDGRHVKAGLLWRSANLAKASESDVSFFQGKGLKLVCDLRTEQERSHGLDVDIPGAQNIWFNVLGALPESAKSMAKGSSSDTRAKLGKAMNPNSFNEEAAGFLADFVSTGAFDGMMENLYVGLVTREDSQREYARMFEAILEQSGGAVLWHCTQGKDRAGLATVFVLSALGVDSVKVMDDFAKSNESYKGMLDVAAKVAAEKGLSEAHQGVIMAMLGVNPAYLKKALDYISANFGTMENYMEQKLGLTKEKLALLREYYLE